MNIHLSYKKYLTPPSTEIVIYPNFETASHFELVDKPNWLKLIEIETERNPRGIMWIKYRVTIDPIFADLLTPGVRFATMSIYYIEALENRRQLAERLQIQLEIIDNKRLTLSKSSFEFQHHQGSSAPESQGLTITTENAWEIVADQEWVTFSDSAANESRSIQLGVNPTGMDIGVHTANFQVNDGETTRTGSVSLIISGEAESDDYLTLSVTSLPFTEVHQQVPSRSGTFTVDSSLPVSFNVDVPWLLLSESSASAGKHSITVSTRDTESLALGSHPAKITVASSYSARTISVLLRIVENHTSGIESGQLYFAGDRNTLVLGNAVPNAEVIIEFSTKTGSIAESYTRKIPYFNNIAEAVIGLETYRMLNPQPLPLEFFTGAFVPVRPLEMDFSLFDKVINSTAITARQNFTGVQFLNGRTPARANVLTNIPEKVSVPRDGLICLSFYQDEPFQGASISGDLTDQIAVSSLNSHIYSLVVNLANYELRPGNALSITAGPIALQVEIKPSELPTNRLIYLNEWDCPEVINLDGILEIDEGDENTSVTFSTDGREHTRIVEVKNPRSFRIGTGNIYSAAEVEWLSGLLRSKKSWLEIDGERIEVVRTFKSLRTFTSREFSRSYTLTFDAAQK